jgi:hypothetical protein
VTDVYISNEVIAPHKLARVAALAHQLAGGARPAGHCRGQPEEGVTRLAQAMNEARTRHTQAQ